MKHLSFRYRGRRNAQQKKEFREAQAARIAKRWDRERAAHAGDPIRIDRVTELVIRDTHRPTMVLRLYSRPTRLGWSRCTVEENGKPLRGRFGVGAIARLLAKVLA